MALPLVLRQADRNRDLRLITSDWLKSYRDGSFVRGIPNNIYFYYHDRLIKQLLDRSMVIVVCDEQDPDNVVGWCCAETTDNCLIIHYIYIKYTFRKNGVARKLIERLLETEKPKKVMYTHRTRIVSVLKEDAGIRPETQETIREWQYNPYYLFENLPFRTFDLPPRRPPPKRDRYGELLPDSGEGVGD